MGKETPQPKETEPSTADALHGLAADVNKNTRQAEINVFGKPLDTSELENDVEKLAATMEQLAKNWDKLGDKVNAILARLGLTPTEFETAMHEPGESVEETEEPEPPDWKTNKGKDLSWKDYNHAENAQKKLAEKPEWMEWIKQTALKYDVPDSTLVTFIEMESSFNPNAKTKYEKGAKGLAQAIDKTFDNYRRAIGQPNADPFDPKTAIDCMGWYISTMVQTVNALVDRGAFPPEYKLSTRSPIRYLYMTYNNGPDGYLVLRRYIENPTKENFAKLRDFQKFIKGKKKDGSVLYDGENRYNYALRVEKVAQAYEQMQA